jgi:hypothetical protein
MARGNIAKEAVEKKIREAFGQNWIGVYDKKLYVWAQENGEQVQVAISLTCPKVPVEIADAPITGDYNFEDDAPNNVVVAAGGYQPAEITQDERDRVVELMKALGL